MSYLTNHIPSLSGDVVVMTRQGLEEVCQHAFMRGYYRGRYDERTAPTTLRKLDDFACVADVVSKLTILETGHET